MKLFSILTLLIHAVTLSHLHAIAEDIQSVINKRNVIVEQHPHLLAFKTLDEQLNQCNLAVHGNIPHWLDGTLLRIGPAKFETQDQLVPHPFDGFAMVYGFDFAQGKLTYTNKFLDTGYYRHAMATGEIIPGFATANGKSIFQRLMSCLFKLFFESDEILYDNANVNIAKIANHFVSLTEVPLAIEFDRKTIATVGNFTFNDELYGDVTTAHPHTDYATGETFNFLTQYGKTSYYHVYKIAPNSTSRELIASVPVEQPAYMHSFALTKDYIILTQIPFTVNPLSLLISSKAFIDNFVFDAGQGTTFTVINRHNGTIVGDFKGQTCFTFHNINAYQNDSSVIIDLVGYDDSSVVQLLSMDELFALAKSKTNTIQKLLRYTIDVSNNNVTCKKISDTQLEMPRINYEHYNTQEYHYVYGIGSRGSSLKYGSSLEKVNVQTGTSITWTNDNCTIGEPVFVACPLSNEEDNGVVMSVVLDHQQKQSFIVILDAKTLKELARAYVPHHIPFGLHGNFFKH